MEENTSKVYVFTDERERILRCEGGYTMGNIEDISKWICIDEGTGDKYNLCQSNYFPTPLYEDHGIPVYKLKNGLAVERTQAEIDADIAALPVPEPQPQPTVADLQAKVVELETALELLVSGATEVTV